MTEQEEQVKQMVKAVLSLMKREWVCAAFDVRCWKAYTETPKYSEHFPGWEPRHKDDYGHYIEVDLGDFDIPNFPGDWKFSLVLREN